MKSINTNKNYSFLFILAALIIAVCATPMYARVQYTKDTSFTLNSAYQKAVKEYPETRLVEKLPSKSILVKRNIVYFKSGERELHLDLYLPAMRNKKKYPVVIIIHGGGWRSGSKEMEEQTSLYMAENGIGAAAVEYTLSGEKLFPESVHNIKSAIRWIKKNSKEYSTDSNNVFLMGGSAGGHLALLSAFTSGLDYFDTVNGEKLSGTIVKGVINIDGVPDLTTPEESGKDTIPSKPSAVKQWLGVKYTDNPAQWQNASPVNHISGNSPPVLFINSSIPRFHAGREKITAELRKLNIYCGVIEFPSSPHTFWLFNPWYQRAMPKAVRFIRTFSK